MSELKISLALKEIKVLVYNINLEKIQSLGKSLEADKLKYRTTNVCDIDIDENLVSITPELIFEYPDENIILCNFKSVFKYQINNLKEIAKFTDETRKNVNIPHDLLITLISASISTARGILFNKNAGTPLENFYFPILDPKALLPIHKEQSTKEETPQLVK